SDFSAHSVQALLRRGILRVRENRQGHQSGHQKKRKPFHESTIGTRPGEYKSRKRKPRTSNAERRRHARDGLRCSLLISKGSIPLPDFPLCVSFRPLWIAT